MSPLRKLVAAQRKRQRKRLALACLAAGTGTASSVLLLGLSGWFISGAALAGLVGSAAATAFNYMLPAVCIRLFAILRTGGHYAERVLSHHVALRALAQLRPRLFAAILAAPVDRALRLTVGDASTRMVQDVDAVEARFVRLSAPWGAPAAFAAGMALLLPAGPAPACATAAILGATLLATRRLAQLGCRRPRRATGYGTAEGALCEPYRRSVRASRLWSGGLGLGADRAGG
jgi:ATP-binding cassette subfamily C protein CydC